MSQTQPNSPDIGNWLKLIRADEVGPVGFARLLKQFDSVDRALGASVSELTKVDGIGAKTAERIAATRDKFDADAELDLAAKLGVWIVTIRDERYPHLLRQIYDPPPVLYLKGTLHRQDSLAVAIVGSRRCSFYGQEQASRLAHLLASAGFTICSGMARGIDTAAHNGALSACGRTLAAQGCGLAHVFPPENKKLFEAIPASGACISELPLQSEPRAEHFPPRNRIIAGLSLATIVIEAPLNSGALITAHAALDYGREVMAVPGRVDSHLNAGPHKLIKEGAKLVENVEDVMEALGYIGEQLKEHVTQAAHQADEKVARATRAAADLKLTGDERRIYDCLSKEASHIEQIITDAGLSPGSVNAALVSLQLKGLVKQLPGSMFVKK